MTQLRKIYIFQPYLFAIYSILVVFQQNKSDILPMDVVRPLLLILILTGLVNYITFRVFKNSRYSSFATFVWLLWLLYFGQIQEFGVIYRLLGDDFTSRLILLVIWTVLLGLLAYPSDWKKQNSKLLSQSLTVSAIYLVIIPTLTILRVAWDISQQTSIMEKRQAQFNVSLSNPNDNSPDIYYIIVDAYGRQDTLQTYQNLDNSDFIN